MQVVHYEGVHNALGDNRIKNFYSVYGGQADWQSVDAFVCLHNAATCELFLPFNRSIIVLTTTRYDAGRRSIGDWRRWNDRLARIAADDRNIVAANNQYDIEYMRSVSTCIATRLSSTNEKCSRTSLLTATAHKEKPGRGTIWRIIKLILLNLYSVNGNMNLFRQ